MAWMKFGICTDLRNVDAVRSAGWDYVELPVKELFDERAAKLPLPVLAANLLLPPSMKIIGAQADAPTIRSHLENVARRAKELGVEVVVFGSGGARNVPQDFDRRAAEKDIADFAWYATHVLGGEGVNLAVEHLNRGECNIVNTVAEAAALVRRIELPYDGLLFDSYHFWLENEPLDNLKAAVDLVVHVHVADRDGRLPPGESLTSDYRPLFRILKHGGYDSRMSVEASNFDVAGRGADVLSFLKQQWKDC